MSGEDKALAAIVLALLLLIGGFVAWDLRHPCIRYEASTCSECAQTMYLPDAEGQPTIPICVAYEQVPCRICAERAP